MRLSAPLLALLAPLVLLAGCRQDLPPSPEPAVPAPNVAPTAALPMVEVLDAPIPQDQIATRLELVGSPRYSPERDALDLMVRVRNDGQATLVGQGAAKVQLGAMLMGPEGPDRAPGLRDFVRAALPLIAPGQSAEVLISLPAEPLLGLPVRLELVQEGVNWFSAYGEPPLDLGHFQRCAGTPATLCDAEGQPVAH